MSRAERTIAALRKRLFEEMVFHRGVDKLIDWVCANATGIGDPEIVKENYRNAIYGLTPEEIKAIESEVDIIG